MGQGYLDTPGIHSTGTGRRLEQGHGCRTWRGRPHLPAALACRAVSHTSLLPGGAVPVSPTSRRPKAQTFSADGFVDVSQQRALRDDELPGLIADYQQAARNAIEAGFDGLEVHSANNYLLEQFLRDSVNDREGPYGGSVANRTRLVVEVMEAVSGEIGAGRSGIRLSPMTAFNDTPRDSDPQAL